MSSIIVDQATFASSDRGSIKGYQLIGKSAGIDRTLSQELCRWAPTQLPADSIQAWAVSCFPMPERRVAVSRTVFGGAEYSNRGGLQVITRFLLFREDQFAEYDCNPVAVIKTALAMGHMRIPLELDRPRLPQVELPSRPMTRSLKLPPEQQDETPYDNFLDEIIGHCLQDQRVAVIGCPHPMDMIADLLPRLPQEGWRDFSFTTGLLPSIRRPFRAHFFASADATIRSTLVSQDIVQFNVA